MQYRYVKNAKITIFLSTKGILITIAPIFVSISGHCLFIHGLFLALLPYKHKKKKKTWIVCRTILLIKKKFHHL